VWRLVPARKLEKPLTLDTPGAFTIVTVAQVNVVYKFLFVNTKGVADRP
jgi:hypothetical protein